MKVSNFWIILSFILFFVSCETQLPEDKKNSRNAKNLHNISIEGSILPDEVYIDGKLTQMEQLKLKPGVYKVHLKKNGYEDIKQQLTVKKEQKDYSLKPDWKTILCKLEIVIDYNAEPSSKDEIKLFCLKGDQEVSLNKLTASISPGKYSITAMHPGYNPFKKEIEIIPGKKNEKVIVSLNALPRNFSIEIISDGEKVDSSSAKIIIDGNTSLGNTIYPGSHKLEIEKDGYQKFVDTILVKGAGSPFLYKVQLQKKSVSKQTKCNLTVKVSSDYPTPMTVISPDIISINGTSLAKLSLYPEGEYELQVQASGYQDFSEKISLSGSEKILEVKLIPLLQKIQVEVSCDYSQKSIQPDKVLLDNKAFEDSLSLLPGKYPLIILKEGYKTVEEEISVNMGTEKNIFSFKMEPFPRKIHFICIDKKTDKNVALNEVLLNGQVYSLKQEHSLLPGNWEIEVQKDGYEKYESSFVVSPGNSVENININLVPKEEFIPTEREITVIVVSDVDTEKAIKPQFMTINKRPIMGALKLKPGKYPIMVFHPEYTPFNSEVEIVEGQEPLEYKVVLISKNRSIVLIPEYNVEPEKVLPLNVKFTNITTQEEIVIRGDVRLKPGSYSVEVTREGYKYTGNKDIFIEPGSSSFEFKISLEKFPKANATTDTQVDNTATTDTQVDNTATTDTQVDNTATTDTQVDNTTTTDTQVDNTTTTDTQVDNSAEPKKCKVLLKITSNFAADNPFEVKPQIATLNGVNIESTSFLPGEYNLVISCDGYNKIEKSITVPEKDTLVLEYSLSPQKKNISYQFTANYPENQTIIPDEILVDNTKVIENILPGTHTFVARKNGYEDWQEEIFVDLSVPEFVVKGILSVKKRTSHFKAINSKSSEALQDFTLKIENMDAIDGYSVDLTPGTYNVTIEKDGFFPATQSIAIDPSHEEMSIEIKLEPKEEKKSDKTPVTVKVYSDSDPETEITPNSLNVANQRYTPGLELEAGNYTIVSYANGHNFYNGSFSIEKGEETKEIKVILVSRPRNLQISYNYDIPPAPSYPACEVEMTSAATQQKIKPTYGQVLKPGKYLLDVKQVGYVYTGPKEIQIGHESGHYKLEITMVQEGKEIPKENKEEKPKVVDRVLKIRGVHPDTFEKITPYRTIVEGKTYQNEPIKIGQEISITILFSGCKTYEGKVKIAEGEGPFEITVDMILLKKVIFTDDSKKATYDNIDYDYEFSIDKQPIEKHLITAYSVDNKVEFHIYVDPKINEIVISAGFRYIEKSLVKDKQPIGYMSKFNVLLLVKHLNKVHNTQGEQTFIESLEDVMKYDMTIRRQWSYEQKEELLYFLQSLEINDETSFSRIEKIIKKIEDMLK